MKLYAKIQDRESYHYERVVLCQFKGKDDNKVFVEEVEHHDETCFKVIIDEGLCRGINFGINFYADEEVKRAYVEELK